MYPDQATNTLYREVSANKPNNNPLNGTCSAAYLQKEDYSKLLLPLVEAF
jgi:hypothetical protein